MVEHMFELVNSVAAFLEMLVSVLWRGEFTRGRMVGESVTVCGYCHDKSSAKESECRPGQG